MVAVDSYLEYPNTPTPNFRGTRTVLSKYEDKCGVEPGSNSAVKTPTIVYPLRRFERVCFCVLFMLDFRSLLLS
jgi:hypothetical protein